MIDGSDSLVKAFGSEEIFIKEVIENCLFFDPLLVKNRFSEIVESYKILNNANQKSAEKILSNCTTPIILPVRKTKRKWKYSKWKANGSLKDNKTKVLKIADERNNRKMDCLISVDSNGNYAVKKIIKSYTGCEPNGPSRTIDNYIMSHIWGEAKDPRYFSNLWNLLLVPNYANPLLDKSYEDDSIHVGFKLLNTIKAVMSEFYNFKELDWMSLDMLRPSYNMDKVISIPEGFMIQYLKDKSTESSDVSTDQEVVRTNVNIPKEDKTIKKDININQMQNQKIEEEIQKVKRRVLRWKSKADQMNSRILRLFMDLSDNGKNGVFVDMLEDEFGTKYPDDVDIFTKNYNQMKNFGVNNHAKVFDEDKEKTVRLWEPVKDFIIETYSH